MGRALDRQAFGRPLAAQGVVREWIDESRLAIEQALAPASVSWISHTQVSFRRFGAVDSQSYLIR